MISSVDMLPGPAWPRSFFKAAPRLRGCICLFDNDTAVIRAAKRDLASRNDPLMIPNGFRDRHLTFPRDCGCHRPRSQSNTSKKCSNAVQNVQLGGWLIAS